MPLHLTTILARNPSVFERQIRNVVEKYARQNLVCAFALTSNDSLNWAHYWQLLRSINETQTVGCLSSSFAGVSTAKGDLSGHLGCSIGVFEPSEASCFRSAIAGDRQAQVGRWHSFRKTEEEESWPLSGNVSWDDVWGRKDETNSPAIDIGSVRPEDIYSVVYFTDRAFQGLSRSLSHAYPFTSRVGLVATPTLTVNEQPATLLHQSSVYSTGAVGLALKKKYQTRMRFQNLHPISEPMAVGISQGNLIHEMNGDSNPTQLLLRILEKTPGTTASNPAAFRFLKERVFVGELGPDGKASRMLHITSGDPSRGGIALSSEVAPLPGTSVQFFIQSDDPHTHIELPNDGKPFEFNFVTVPELLSSDELYDMEDNHSIVFDGTFLAATDVGIVSHRPGDRDACTGLDCPVGTIVSLE